MEQILDSVRKIIKRWVSSESELTADANPGDTSIYVDNALRFKRGEKCLLTDGTHYEYPFTISSVVSNNIIEVEEPVRNNGWTVDNNVTLRKSINGQMVHAVYLGDPSVIPRFPAITVNGTSRSSEWTTLETTTEKYSVEITAYVEDSTHEDGYRTLLHLTDIIQKGLKRNIFPLVGEKAFVDLAADLVSEETFIKLTDTSGIEEGQLIVLEDKFKGQDLRVKTVVDGSTIEVTGKVAGEYLLIDDPRIILVDRFLYKSWPSEIDFGFIHKETLLKAGKINWSAEEIEVQGTIGWGDAPSR
ncbi:hypothetical protein CL614_02950 [archaeon]|nr:hypothetical protein [archaeon]|tara:strand:+ start:1394 stop:2296 length:903 start_codon:yes stop_codon:yes gene_type:complete